MTNRRVLIVEDDDAIGGSVEGVLIDEGYDVKLARNGACGYEQLSMFKPDVVLLDLSMPVTSGIQLMSDIYHCKKEFPPIIVMSASPDARKRCAPYPVKDVLNKPFALEALLQAIRKVTGEQEK